MTHFSDFKINFSMCLLASSPFARRSSECHGDHAVKVQPFRTRLRRSNTGRNSSLAGLAQDYSLLSITTPPPNPQTSTVLPFKGNRQLTRSALCKTSFVSWQRRNENILGGWGHTFFPPLFTCPLLPPLPPFQFSFWENWLGGSGDVI